MKRGFRALAAVLAAFALLGLSGCASMLKSMGAVVKSDLDARDAAMNAKIEEVNAKINELNAILVQANEAVRNAEQVRVEIEKVKVELAALSSTHAKDQEQALKVAASMDQLSLRLTSLSNDTLLRLAEVIRKAVEEPAPAASAPKPPEPAPAPATP